MQYFNKMYGVSHMYAKYLYAWERKTFVKEHIIFVERMQKHQNMFISSHIIFFPSPLSEDRVYNYSYLIALL